MSKKILSLLLALFMAVTLLTACGSQQVLQQSDGPVQATEQPENISPATGDASKSVNEARPAVQENEAYSTPEAVAEYIHLYGHLPNNFITKNKARDLGWDNSQGNLWDVAPGKSIGGDRFGNYEGLLPDGNYRECDVNYEGGYRGAERIIYGTDGSIYYTNDHYNSFTRLY